MQKQTSLFGRINKWIGIPREGLPGGFSLFLNGDKEAVVRGCREILVYERERISLSIDRATLTLVGRDLFCSSFGMKNVTVSGRISGISIEEAQK